MRISVVIPVYNEEKTVEALLEKVIQAKDPKHEWEIIVVNDSSTDKTVEKIEKFKETVRLVSHEHNQGKGKALQTGFALAQGDVVIIQDADLEYDPCEYKNLLKPILTDVADVVYGSRFMGSQPHRVLYFWHYVGNRFITILSNMTTNLNLSDMETGYKVIRTHFLKKIVLEEYRFGIEPELTAKLAQLHARFYEVGISYHGRTYAEGKKITWKDGLFALWCIFKYGILARLTRNHLESER